jgi:cupin 2 domain-containing protein
MNQPLGNILEQIPARLEDEQFCELLAAPGLRIERIVSIGHTTPPGQWLEQDRSEWVLLIQGEALVRLEHEAEIRRLRHGDHLHIPSGTRHRVEWTAAEPPTIWLAVHYGQARPPPEPDRC